MTRYMINAARIDGNDRDLDGAYLIVDVDDVTGAVTVSTQGLQPSPARYRQR